MSSVPYDNSPTFTPPTAAEGQENMSSDLELIARLLSLKLPLEMKPVHQPAWSSELLDGGWWSGRKFIGSDWDLAGACLEKLAELNYWPSLKECYADDPMEPNVWEADTSSIIRAVTADTAIDAILKLAAQVQLRSETK